jgi:hypothetical protein
MTPYGIGNSNCPHEYESANMKKCACPVYTRGAHTRGEPQAIAKNGPTIYKDYGNQWAVSELKYVYQTCCGCFEVPGSRTFSAPYSLTCADPGNNTCSSNSLAYSWGTY